MDTASPAAAPGAASAASLPLAAETFDYLNLKGLFDTFSPITAEDGDDEIRVYIDGTEVGFDVPPQIIDGRTLVPMRAIFEGLGAEVAWNDMVKAAVAAKDDVYISIQIGKSYFRRDDEVIPIDVPARIIDARTFVPVRAVAESFDCTVDWLPETKTVRIRTEEALPALLPDDDVPILTVGDVTFSRNEFYRYADEVTRHIPGARPEDILEEMKLLCAVRIYNERTGAALDPVQLDRIDAAAASLIRGENYRELLDSAGISDRAFRRYINLMKEMLTLIGSVENTDFSDEEVLLFGKTECVLVKALIFEDFAGAEKALDTLKNGGSFEEALRRDSMYSAIYYGEPENAEGDLFCAAVTGKTDPAVWEAVAALEENEYTDVVDCGGGTFAVIKRYPLGEEQMLGTLRREIAAMLAMIRADAALEKIAETLPAVSRDVPDSTRPPENQPASRPAET